MAQVYTVCFLKWTSTVGVSSTYTVPAGKVAIVTSMDIVSNPSATAHVVEIAEPGVLRWWVVAIPGANLSYHWEGRQAFIAGEGFRAVSNQAGSYVRISGYLFDDV